MPAFLDDITPFYGNREKNEDGLSLPEFLEKYDPNHYQNPSVTADILVFQYEKDFTLDRGLKLLMIQRKNHPGIGYWALPGGFVNLRENIEDAAKRELKEETGLDHIAVEQLYCWGDWKRDPRTRIVTISYLAMIEDGQTVQAGDDAADAVWMNVSMKKNSEKIYRDEITGKERCSKVYQIDLKNEERRLDFSLLVEVIENTTGFLKEVKYHVIRGSQVAFDHPCFIAQALLHLK